MPSLPVPPRRTAAPETPEDLYDTLQGTDPNVRHLWSHQADALRTYYEEFRESSDVALEFPTGAGKTLVGLLIAEWRRLMFRERVAFVCPTNQLAHQAASKATGYGVDAVLLIGSHREWAPADRAAFEAGNAVAITNYHHIFNSNPKLDAQALVFDDAHAGEPAVIGRWKIEADRDTDLYDALREIVEPSLPGHFARAIGEDDLDPKARYDVELVPPPVVASQEGRIAAALDEHVEADSPASYAWSVVRTGLASCLIYVSWSSILIRPLIAPTATLPEFADTRQRVYMSATLGQAGELERSFGVRKIDRIPLPRGWERQGSGRRLPLFPSLAGEADFHESIKEAMRRAEHSLVIAPSERQADIAAETYVPDEIPIVERDEIREDFDAFTEQDAAVLVLANRYDGMDLPDEACRLVLLHGLPIGTHLQERFLVETLGAREALDERIRTRVTQGMGRATRNRQDFAVVIFTGSELTSFISREDVRASIRPELQAELELGLSYADEEVSSLPAIEAFFDQGDDWEPVEKYLRGRADELESKPMPGAEPLSAAARHEIRAWEHAWRDDFAGARDHARAAAQALVGEAVKQYRALWRYLSASWAQTVAERSGDDVDRRLAAELQREAKNAFASLRWYPRFTAEAEAPTVGPEYSWRADRAADWLDRHRRGARLNRELEQLERRIASNEWQEFELGLEALGSILGFESLRPNETADPDCAWREGTELWMLWEAKTMEGADGQIPAREIRQANTHHTWVARQLGWEEPRDSVTVVVCSREEIHPDGVSVANERLALASPEAVRAIAERATAALAAAGNEAPALTPERLRERMGQLFVEHRLETATLLKELASVRIAAAS